MNVGITGSRRLVDDPSRRIVKGILLTLPSHVTLITGACLGVDTFAAHFWHGELGRQVHTVVPAERTNVDRQWKSYCNTFDELPWSAEPYRARNERLVELSELLIGFPLHPEHDRRAERSGTWMTIRIARKANKPTHVYRLWE